MSCWHDGAVSGSAMINSPERAAVMHTCRLRPQAHSSRATALGSLPASRIPIRFWQRLLDCSANILHQFMLPPTGHRGVGFFPKAVLSRGRFSTLPVVWKRFCLAAPMLRDQEVALSHFLYRPGRVRCWKGVLMTWKNSGLKQTSFSISYVRLSLRLLIRVIRRLRKVNIPRLSSRFLTMGWDTKIWSHLGSEFCFCCLFFWGRDFRNPGSPPTQSM